MYDLTGFRTQLDRTKSKCVDPYTTEHLHKKSFGLWEVIEKDDFLYPFPAQDSRFHLSTSMYF